MINRAKNHINNLLHEVILRIFKRFKCVSNKKSKVEIKKRRREEINCGHGFSHLHKGVLAPGHARLHRVRVVLTVLRNEPDMGGGIASSLRNYSP